MYPMIPGEAMTGVLEMVCYACTAVAAILTCFVTLRF